MSSDLEDAVGGGVVDGFASREVLRTQAGDDFRARGMAIAKRALHPASVLDPGKQVCGKAGILLWEVGPVEGDRDRSDFPVSAGSVLARTDFPGECPGALEVARR